MNAFAYEKPVFNGSFASFEKSNMPEKLLARACCVLSAIRDAPNLKICAPRV